LTPYLATHTIVPEEECFDAIEYVDFNDLVDDFMDLLHPESVSVVFTVFLNSARNCKTEVGIKLATPRNDKT
jgi:hypothetical protein